MELLMFVMNNVDLLDDLLESLSQEKDFRATVIDSQGMAHILKDTSAFFGLRNLLNDSKVTNKTIFMALDKSRIEKALEIIESVVGDLDNPDTGVLFTLPISFIKGYTKKEN